MTKATKYRHIILENGRPRIEGSRMKVEQLAIAHLHNGWSADELHWQFPGISLAEIYSAMAYYYDHRADLDKQIKEDAAWIDQLAKQEHTHGPSRQELEARLGNTTSKRSQIKARSITVASKKPTNPGTAKQTSPRAASAAGKVLSSSKANSKAKTAAASDLAQTNNSKTTSKPAASAAAKTLADPKSNKAQKTAAASDLSQKASSSPKPKKKT